MTSKFDFTTGTRLKRAFSIRYALGDNAFVLNLAAILIRGEQRIACGLIIGRLPGGARESFFGLDSTRRLGRFRRQTRALHGAEEHERARDTTRGWAFCLPNKHCYVCIFASHVRALRWMANAPRARRSEAFRLPTLFSARVID